MRKLTATRGVLGRWGASGPHCNLFRSTRKHLLALLRAEEIGITLSEEDQLDPSNPPPRSSSITRRPNTSRCKAGGAQRNPPFLRDARRVTLSLTRPTARSLDFVNSVAEL